MLRNDRTVAQLRKKIDAGTANMRELQKLTQAAGLAAGELMGKKLHKEFPDGQISQADVRRVISPIRRENFSFVSKMTAEFQKKIYEDDSLGINPVTPEYDMVRENALVEEISRRSFTDEFY